MTTGEDFFWVRDKTDGTVTVAKRISWMTAGVYWDVLEDSCHDSLSQKDFDYCYDLIAEIPQPEGAGAMIDDELSFIERCRESEKRANAAFRRDLFLAVLATSVAMTIGSAAGIAFVRAMLKG